MWLCHLFDSVLKINISLSNAMFIIDIYWILYICSIHLSISNLMSLSYYRLFTVNSNVPVKTILNDFLLFLLLLYVCVFLCVFLYCAGFIPWMFLLFPMSSFFSLDYWSPRGFSPLVRFWLVVDIFLHFSHVWNHFVGWKRWNQHLGPQWLICLPLKKCPSEKIITDTQ